MCGRLTLASKIVYDSSRSCSSGNSSNEHICTVQTSDSYAHSARYIMSLSSRGR